jgi:hypothetical protein
MQPANSATPLPRQHRPRLRVLALHSFRTSGGAANQIRSLRACAETARSATLVL